ncbi:MAG: type II/IV secretion system protein [Flavobacteriales bacterium]|nr:type II/IV secretion system protein [Flavobacteriales bacterium]
MSVEVKDIQINPKLQQLLTADQAMRLGAVPFREEDGVLSTYVSTEKLQPSHADELELITGKRVTLVPIAHVQVERVLTRFYRQSGPKEKTYHFSEDRDVLQDMLKEAKDMNASDIHFEVYEERARIRFRIDGHLMERYAVPVTEYPSLINRIKIKANLDIAEKRLPQDGRIMVNTDQYSFDIRVSIVPTLHGEKAVLRLLSKDATDIQIDRLGFEQSQLKTYLESARKPHGIILISGPTGSGKTTTLYATLKILNEESRNVLTIEDPIEYTLEGINQVQLNERIGLDFSKALRTFLRQDPDVIMLGEIRDAETAKMAVRAALTGHLVLSTVHTNSAWGTVSRLVDMGVPSYLIAGTLNLSVAQRLVRKLCPKCKGPAQIEEGQLPGEFGKRYVGMDHFEPIGCESCFYTGYSGRKALYEVIPMDHDLAAEVRIGNMEVRDLLQQRAIRSIPDQAMSLLQLGETSVDEVYSLLLNV